MPTLDEPSRIAPATSTKGVTEDEQPDAAARKDKSDDDQQCTSRRAASVQVPQAPASHPEIQEHRGQTENKHERRMLWTQTIIASAATGALLSTLWSLYLTRNTFRATQRATILIDEIHMRPADAGPDANVPGSFVWRTHGNVGLRIKNFGHGPAKRVHISTRVRCMPMGEPCPDPATIEPYPGSDAVLGPDHAISADSPFVWKDKCCAGDKTLARLNITRVECLYDEANPSSDRRPTHELFASTKITYLDQFQRSHWTYGCAVWNPTLRIWDFADKGNDFD